MNTDQYGDKAIDAYNIGRYLSVTVCLEAGANYLCTYNQKGHSAADQRWIGYENGRLWYGTLTGPSQTFVWGEQWMVRYASAIDAMTEQVFVLLVRAYINTLHFERSELET